jgi:hypothetical protein
MAMNNSYDGASDRPILCAVMLGSDSSEGDLRRVRARKLRQRRWRCVTGAAIAGDVTAGPALASSVLVSYAPCAERRRLLICSGAARCWGLPYGGSTRFYGGSTRWQGSSGPVYGAAAAVRGLVSSSGRLSVCFPDG